MQVVFFIIFSKFIPTNFRKSLNRQLVKKLNVYVYIKEFV